jgi:glycosyltransferase involved in cell wall biosynthesis
VGFRRKAVTCINLAVATCHQLIGHFTHYAELSVTTDPLPRLEAVWLKALTHAGSLHIPSSRLRRLAHILDLPSFIRLVSRCRKSGPDSLHINDADGDPSNVAIRIVFDYYSSEPHALAIPYAMHPNVYAEGLSRYVRRLRAEPRRFRIVFAGSSDRNYDRITTFPLLPRPAIIECLLDAFRQDILVIRRPSDFGLLARTERPIAVVLNGNVCGPADARLPLRNYLRLMASADFALCPPGLTVPHSHNLVEAMAVGTFPITNYYNYCRPRLEPERTCLGFTTADDLVCQVRAALAMDPSARARMRSAASNHYDSEYGADAFGAKLRSALDNHPGPIQLMAINEFWSPRMFMASKGGIDCPETA